MRGENSMKNYIIVGFICLGLLTACGKETEKNSEVETTAITESEQQSTEEIQIEDSTTEIVTEDVQDAWNTKFDQARRLDYYGKILWNLQYMQLLPGRSYDDGGDYSAADFSDSQYAIFDVDCDGIDELLIYQYMEGKNPVEAYIYQADPNKDGDCVVTELAEYPALTCYSNGVIKAEFGYNQTYSESVWPYSIYAYNSNAGMYECKGMVEGWDKTFGTNREGETFPDAEDTDGDGVLYYVIEENTGIREDVRNKEDCDAWFASYIGDATEIAIDWKDLNEENYGVYATDNVSLFLEQYNQKSATYGTDLGKQFMEATDQTETLDQIETMLQNTYGMQIQKEMVGEYVMSVSGTVDGMDVYASGKEGPENFIYRGKKLGDLTICGVYQGMPESDAIAILENAGFYYWEDGGEYVTGKMDGNYEVSLIIDNGAVSEVSMGLVIAY